MKAIINLSILIILFILSSCVQQTQPKTIHFKLDMTAFENPKDVGVRGSIKPLSWETTLALTDNNNDGIYEGIFKLNTANYGLEFKFVNQNDQFELPEQNNRTIKFEYQPETITYEAVFNNPNGKLAIKK